MYKESRYRLRSLPEIIGDIKMAKVTLGRRLLKVFLCDGDAISLDTEMLLKILSELNDAFPFLQQVATYVGPRSTLNKSAEELKQLRRAGLTTAYLGVESGDDRVLKAIRKGATASEMLEAGRKIVGSGMHLTAMVMLGLGGKKDASISHALATAEMINQMKPNSLGLLTTVPVENTSLARQVKEGTFQLLDAYGTVEEMKNLFEHITLDNCWIDGTHGSNFLPVTGTFQKDKQAMLNQLENVLNNKNADMEGIPYVGRF